MIDTPVSSSPAMIARSTGAAPRQRGSSDGCTLSISQRLSSGSLSSAPYAHTSTISGSAAAMRSTASGPFTLSGWATSMPSARAATAAGGGASLRPRPRRRSGRVTTSAGRCALPARRSSTATANGEVPRRTVRTPDPLGRRLGGLAQRPHRRLALVARRAVEDENAVEVVHLVLDHAGLEAARLDEDRVSVLVLGADAHVHGALDVDEHVGQRQASLLGDLLVLPGPLELRVHERDDRRLGLDAVDENAAQAADLGGGEADPERVLHEVAHRRDLAAQVVVEDLDLPRRRLQDRVAPLRDVSERGLAPRLHLGGQLGALAALALERLVVGVIVLGHGVRGYCGSTSTEMAAARPSRVGATASTASRTARTAAPRSAALTTSWSRSRSRRRKSGAGPSTSAPGGSIRSRRAAAAAPAAAAPGAEHTTRMSVVKGG